MTKSLAGLWLRNIRRVSKVQQAQGRKLFKSLLAKAVRTPPAKRAKSVKTTRPVDAAKALKLAKVIGVTTAKPRRKTTTPPAPAVALPALPGSWQKSFFSLPGAGLAPARRMMYWLYLPSGIALKPRPLVVMLHGCQQTANDFAASTRMNQLAERKGFAVLYPQQSITADRHRCWHWYKRATQQGLGDVRLIAEMIKQVQAKHRLDTSRAYVAGLSAGAGLAAILALRHPRLIAAVGLHSAPVYGTTDSAMSAFQAMQQGSGMAYRETAREFSAEQPEFPGMPVMLIHGKRDPVVRHINADQLAAQFAIIDASFISGAEPVQRNYPGRAGGRSPRHAYKTLSYYAGRKPRLVKCEIDSLGHAWSGGDGSLAYSSPEGPDATLLMWTFFALQRRLLGPPMNSQA
jgi:poly(hydroxyalkanoate) depolymerase family esterase